MSLLATVGQVNAVLQTARGLIDSVRGATAPAAAKTTPQRTFAETLNEAATQLIGARDLDGDGKLGASELSIRPDTFGRIDSNGDGALTKTELVQGYRAFAQDQYVERLFARLDANTDTQLNALELGVSAEQFAQLDVNTDGAVERDELLRALASQSGEQA
jgi:hypothetical protein